MVRNFNFVRCWPKTVTAASCLDRMSRAGSWRDGRPSITPFVYFVNPILSVHWGKHLHDQIRGGRAVLEGFME